MRWTRSIAGDWRRSIYAIGASGVCRRRGGNIAPTVIARSVRPHRAATPTWSMSLARKGSCLLCHVDAASSITPTVSIADRRRNASNFCSTVCGGAHSRLASPGSWWSWCAIHWRQDRHASGSTPPRQTGRRTDIRRVLRRARTRRTTMGSGYWRPDCANSKPITVSNPQTQARQRLDNARRLFRLERSRICSAEVAAGRCSIDRVLHPLFAEELARQVQLPQGVRLRTHQIKVAQCAVHGWAMRSWAVAYAQADAGGNQDPPRRL